MADLRPARPRSFYIPALDGLRVLACLMVFAHHGLPNSLNGRVSPAVDGWWHALIDFGAYGVTIFFALSSFLITRLLIMEREATGDINIRDFYLRRVLRIWPVYFFVVFLGAVVGPAIEGVPLGPALLLRFLTFNGNYAQVAGAQPPYAIGILWSVCVEEQFYLVWPHVVKHRRGRALGVVLFLMLALGIGSRWFVASHGGGWPQIWFNSLCQLDCFAWGAGAALLYGAGRLKLPAVVGNGIALTALGAGLVIAKACPLVNLHPGAVPILNAEAYAAMCFLGATITWAVAACKDSVLGLGPICRQGKFTYGLYCYHTLTLVIARWALNGHGVALTTVVWLGLTALVTTLSWNLLEQPFLNLKRRFQTVPSGAPSPSRTSESEKATQLPAMAVKDHG